MDMLMIGDLPGERKMVEDRGIQVRRREEYKRQRCSDACISSFRGMVQEDDKREKDKCSLVVSIT